VADKIFCSSKATMHIYSHTKFERSILITFWRMALHLSPGRAVKLYVRTSQWHVHWLLTDRPTSMQPPESQARRQSLPLPARKRSMMADTRLNRSPLRHWAYLTHLLASSCVISVWRFLRTQRKSEKRDFCFKDARCNPIGAYYLPVLPRVRTRSNSSAQNAA